MSAEDQFETKRLEVTVKLSIHVWTNIVINNILLTNINVHKNPSQVLPTSQENPNPRQI